MKIKVCFKCKQEKPIKEFGYNAYYATRGACDSRSVYCKACRRDDMNQRRATGNRKPTLLAQVYTSDVAMTVLEAVANGHRTREQIEAATRLEQDRIGNVLAELTFNQSAIKIVRVGKDREFRLTP